MIDQRGHRHLADEDEQQVAGGADARRQDDGTGDEDGAEQAAGPRPGRCRGKEVAGEVAAQDEQAQPHQRRGPDEEGEAGGDQRIAGRGPQRAIGAGLQRDQRPGDERHGGEEEIGIRHGQLHRCRPILYSFDSVD